MQIAKRPILALSVYCLFFAVSSLKAETGETQEVAPSEDSYASLALAIQDRDLGAIKRLAVDLEEDGVDTFRNLVESLPHSPYRELLFRMLVEELTRFDGEFAVQYALNLPSSLRQDYASQAMLRWVIDSPDQAWDFFLVLTNFGQDRTFHAEMLIFGAAQTDVEKAFQFYTQLSDEIDCIDCSAKVIIKRLFFNGEEEKIPEYESRIEAPFKLDQWRKNKWEMWGYYQPLTALERLKSIESSTERDEARGELYSGWARYQPKECIEHLVAFESDEVFSAAFPTIINEWGKNSLLDESLDLIKSIDRDSLTDRSIVAINSRLATLDPDFSWELTNSIENSAMRKTGIRNFVWSVSKFDPGYLRKLIDESTGTEDQIEFLWWFLQYVPAHGQFDLSSDMRYFKLIASYQNDNRSLDVLVSNVLNVSSTTSKYISPTQLASTIAEQAWLSDADKKHFIQLLESR